MFGTAEIKAVNRVMATGKLSGYLAGNLTGGKEVEALEREWEEYFNVKHAIAVNSATSGLLCACNSIETESFIVPTFSMSASAAMPAVNHHVVFSDIEKTYYCMDNVVGRIPAVTVDLFGNVYDVTKFGDNFVIEDASQAIGAMYHNKYAGTLGDIGVFSLNYHKHIHCGEGGIVVTNNDTLAYRIRLLRNHSETVSPLLGFNFRLTEIQAAIARVQLKKLKKLLARRLEKVDYLLSRLQTVEGISLPKTREGCTHSYYLVPIRFFQQRGKYESLLKQNGINISVGYNPPLHLLPFFHHKIGSYPNAEKAFRELICFAITPETTKRELDTIIRILHV